MDLNNQHIGCHRRATKTLRPAIIGVVLTWGILLSGDIARGEDHPWANSGNSVILTDSDWNVGIGVPTAYAKLHTSGDIRLGGASGDTKIMGNGIWTATDFKIQPFVDWSGMGIDFFGTTASGAQGSVVFKAGGHTADLTRKWVFRDTYNTGGSPVDRVVIEVVTGKVGIGTNTPATKLHVLQSDNLGSYTDLVGNSYAGLAHLRAAMSSAPSRRIAATLNGEMEVNFATTPSSDIDVSSITGTVATPSANTVHLDNVWLRGSLGMALHRGSGRLQQMTGVYGGYWHIGTGTVAKSAALVAQMSNASSGTITNNYGLLVSDIGNNGTMTNTYGVYVGDMTAGSQTNKYSFYASDASAFNYFAGNVGIGTTSTAYKLAVKGTIGAQEITVTSTSSWPDYVFKPGYRVKPLREVNAYVKQHGHLPGIPSEKEVREKGVSVGEMQAKLLAKVEELTLLMIQAEERNNRLEKQCQELRRENAAIRERVTRVETGATSTTARR